MIIKKFQAYNEKDAVNMAKDEMGNEAVILNIKTIKHRGFARLFKKNIIEVTAALEEKEVKVEASRPRAIDYTAGDMTYANPTLNKDADNGSNIEAKLNSLQEMLEKQISAGSSKNDKKEKEAKEEKEEEIEDEVEDKGVNKAFTKLIYGKLVENEVDENIAKKIIEEVEESLTSQSSLDTYLSGIYQKIILKLGQAKTIELAEGKTNLVFFVGPTGVGKTTTIAKLASHFKLDKKAKVALITSDTYRIAAVEQLRTYANILDIPMQVVYTVEEFNDAVEMFAGFDLIFVDTAGRSHKNLEQCNEVMHLVNDCKIDEEKINKQVYLVLSTATKYKDLLKITEAYAGLKKYNLVFTKLDETTYLGNILNIKLKTDAPLSYVTSGQVVPDDISRLNAQKVAKQLLGGGE
ncbi:MAG: flagellar biosynthesis protein FlhF [Lachnospiraceae bacterium]|nr:flagellar biosynthesis protein FlhF [Lachnospiraceae bacterium]